MIFIGKGVVGEGGKLNKDHISIYALHMDTDNRVGKAWDGEGSGWREAIGGRGGGGATIKN